MPKSNKYIFVFILWVIYTSTPLVAQNMGTLNGTIIDAETNEPLPGAHVYLANTTIGDITNPSGHFVIEDIQAGAYQLIITMIGYKTYQEPVFIKADEATDLKLKLAPDVYQVGEITVTDSQPKHWKRDLNRFKRMFLGITRYRSGCDIENPFTISFVKDESGFNAASSAPIVVINKSTGYKITYHLSLFSASGGSFRFTGFPVFEEMTPKNNKEEKKWNKHRQQLYAGSFQHFLRSLAAGTTEEEGFSLFLYPDLQWRQPHQKFIAMMEREQTQISPARILKEHKVSYERSMQFSGYLHIIYDHEVMSRDFYEWVAMNYSASKEPVRAVLKVIHREANFNEVGFLNDSFDVARYGYWNWESGLCNWLPFNYGL